MLMLILTRITQYSNPPFGIVTLENSWGLERWKTATGTLENKTFLQPISPEPPNVLFLTFKYGSFLVKHLRLSEGNFQQQFSPNPLQNVSREQKMWERIIKRRKLLQTFRKHPEIKELFTSCKPNKSCERLASLWNQLHRGPNLQHSWKPNE